MHSTPQPLYLLHWSLLVRAVGILTSDSIDQNDSQEADAMLQDFVPLMAALYDTTKCTMNIHILQPAFGKLCCQAGSPLGLQ